MISHVTFITQQLVTWVLLSTTLSEDKMNTTDKFWLTHSEYNVRGRSKELGAAEKTISKNYCDIRLCS